MLSEKEKNSEFFATLAERNVKGNHSPVFPVLKPVN
jgi:hypothetical protein